MDNAIFKHIEFIETAKMSTTPPTLVGINSCIIQVANFTAFISEWADALA